MQRRSIGPAWKVALAVVALMAMAMAIYVQIFEWRSRQEEDRLAAARLEAALAESRVRLKAELLAQLRSELEKGSSTEPSGDQPLPGAVLRRGEAGGRALQQVLDSRESQEAVLARLQERLDALTRQMKESDQAVRQDLNQIRAEVRREREASGKVLSLLLIALVPLVVHFLASLWSPQNSTRDEANKDD
jgi:hypothetical protein